MADERLPRDPLQREAAVKASRPETPARRFIHLRVHSAYSLLEGALQLGAIVGHAVKDEAPAIAVTDTNNLFGALEFAQKAVKDGIQPIIGCQIDLAFSGEASDGQRDRRRHGPDMSPVVLIAASEDGYSNLVRLISKVYLETPPGEPVHLTSAMLEDRCDGLICLTGGPRGPIGSALKADRRDLAEQRLLFLKGLFGDRLYVELERVAGYDRMVEKSTVDLAYTHDLPLVATNEAFFSKREDYEAHDALIAIAEGSVVAADNRRRLSPDNFLRGQAEMARLFSDLPEAIDNTVEIAMRCSYYPKTRSPILPRFTGADAADKDAAEKAEAAELARQAREGLEARLAAHGPTPGYTVEQYRERLEFELGIIEKMKFPGYFLIVADFIKWAKAQGIPVGPGRGSGAGSLVAYSTTITDIDPLRFSLLFERFLNPDRVSMPDFDIDFCQDRREEVIRYVQQKYGRDQVGQIITFGTLQARAVLRDVGRVLQMPYGQVDKLSKMVPQNPANPVKLADAIANEPRFAEEAEKEPIVQTLLDTAQKLEGLYRHASTHAAGIVIGDRPLSELVPMYRDPRSDMPVTQFNMKYVEQAGLVKFDFLGLKTLTVLETAVKLIRRRGVDIDLAKIPLDDPDTYAMLSRGEVVGVFQVESAGMRKALIGMRPDCIEDIIALVALYRPGPMENIPTYNARKHGEEEMASIHPKIDHLVKETQGVIVYQEQVMQIAQELSGYSLGEADLLRRAMGKKIRAEMDKQRERFVTGAVERGVSKQQADFIFDLLAKFADYGFNKSHAAAYAVVSYQTAYLKAHYPVEFLAASMTLDMSNTDKLADFRQDAMRLGIEVVPPSVMSSFRPFEVGENKIFYSLAALKGVGDAAVEHIVEKRGEKPFKNLADFCERVDPKIVGKRVFESLIMAGALDCFGHDRAQMMAGVERMMGLASLAQQNAISGQADIFGASLGSQSQALNLPATDPWLAADKLHREFQIVGFYLSAHPLDEYKSALQKMRVQNWAEFSAAVKRGAAAGRLAGTVTSKQERKTRTGNKMGVVQFSDTTGQYEAVLFSEGLAQYRDMLEPGSSVVIMVAAEDRPEGVNLRINSVQSLDDEASRIQKALRIFVRDDGPSSIIQSQLKQRGDSQVSIIVLKGEAQGEIEIGLGNYRVSPQIASAMRAVQGVVDVELV
ncbi:DNA polymerase III subunit alpha [Mesorhizobium sp. CA18]|uniref:DNA polymerase III subunit alpha n=1 Tax=unclassified Mesorhizobium TaxID=325217 RepID=UPI001CCA836D|nr:MULTISPECIES: DNA polymerase III subunit alpha [unclassified Mesorhizobium]MBZ9733795.1 DNA polymerase III subunit alpha [Mesorhizobium sp. CA9]MBZ9825468.1 DNA polymerase III subunit alpha [Mesorhizobium sp. CA18]MBZ9831893.1 DNA polymerase III subunit alpha [Mesorhizobium sp. CA2]MBZ9836892.1 DNA polymerase III subunit alpha [Mesorhizobium sp. CA3]MBZ9875200.1 DNA polymerase III subunit alpha [Mesorhizobium sp. Ca11]